jgi:hypothetical protein
MLGQGQSQSGSFISAADLAVDLAEGRHCLLNVVGRNPDSGVAYRDNKSSVLPEA